MGLNPLFVILQSMTSPSLAHTCCSCRPSNSWASDHLRLASLHSPAHAIGSPPSPSGLCSHALALTHVVMPTWPGPTLGRSHTVFSTWCDCWSCGFAVLCLVSCIPYSTFLIWGLCFSGVLIHKVIPKVTPGVSSKENVMKFDSCLKIYYLWMYFLACLEFSHVANGYNTSLLM